MLAEIRNAISAASDPDARLRLHDCVPWLLQALGNCAPVDTLMIASATPKGATIFAADGWPIVNYDEPVDDGKVALAVHEAIEGGVATDTILRGITRLLGRSGLAAATSDAAHIVANGGRPLVVVLTEHSGSAVTIVATVTAWEERRVLH